MSRAPNVTMHPYAIIMGKQAAIACFNESHRWHVWVSLEFCPLRPVGPLFRRSAVDTPGARETVRQLDPDAKANAAIMQALIADGSRQIVAGHDRNAAMERERLAENAARIAAAKARNAAPDLLEALRELLDVSDCRVDYRGASWYVLRNDETSRALSGVPHPNEKEALAEHTYRMTRAQDAARIALSMAAAS
jgi:hypothetical protein